MSAKAKKILFSSISTGVLFLAMLFVLVFKFEVGPYTQTLFDVVTEKGVLKAVFETDFLQGLAYLTQFIAFLATIVVLVLSAVNLVMTILFNKTLVPNKIMFIASIVLAALFLVFPIIYAIKAEFDFVLYGGFLSVIAAAGAAVCHYLMGRE